MKKEYVTVRVEDLIPYANNPRKNEQAVEAVRESIKQVGYITPIVIDENNEILAGHTRLKALDTDTVEVLRVTGLTEEQKKKYRLLDNKTGELASWDWDKLEMELEGLDFKGFDFGFPKADIINELFGDAEPEPYDKDIEEEYGNGEEYLERKRIIITYDEDTEPALAQMIGVEKITAVTYRVEDLL